jgi:putative ABC transport system substrate-binding protein
MGMKRREFLGLVGGAAASPLAAKAQQPASRRIGYVWVGDRATDTRGAGLRQGLADKGYVIGRNLVVEERYAQGHAERIPALIAELLELKVDVLATPGTPITLAAQRATSTVPIVMLTGDPIGAGLVASLAHPGANITGLSLLSGDYSAKWLELLKEAVPKLGRVAVLSNPDNPQIVRMVESLRQVAQALDLEIVVLPARPTDLEATFAAIAGARLQGLVVTDDSSIDLLVPRIIEFAAEHRLPAIYPFSTAVQRGGLMSYSADFFELWRRAAGHVDRILKGSRPSDLPVEQATAVALKVNLKTAKRFDLVLPPTLLFRADEIIE